MVDKVTYRQLAIEASNMGKPIEEVASAHGIDRAKLDEMSREYFSSGAGSNVDVAKFDNAKAYCVVLPDGFKFLVKSTTDFAENSSEVMELNPGINEMLKEHGYIAGALQNGILTLHSVNGGAPLKVTLNEEVAALTGADGSHKLPEVAVTGSRAAGEERKFVNTVANGVATSTNVTAGTFNNVYKSMSAKFDKLSDEDKAKAVAAATDYAEALKSGDKEKQQQAEKTILAILGYSDGWTNPSTGELVAATIVGVAAVAVITYFTGGLGLLVSGSLLATACNDYYDIDNIDIGVKQITDNSTVAEAMSAMASLLAKIADLETQIAFNTSQTNEKLDELKAEIQKLQKELEQIKGHLVTIITNQENSAENAEKYYKLILNAIGNNTDLLAIVVDQLSKSNETLEMIKELMVANNADNKEILEAITKCKYGLDQLHQDNEEIKKLIKDIKAAIEKLPDEFKTKFAPYFNQIIKGITDNGDKIAALAKLLNIISQTLAKMSQKMDKLDLTKIEDTLVAILDKMGDNSKKLDDLAELLKTINNSVKINGETQQKILEAINAANGAMASGFNTLIKLGEENNKLQKKTNDLINIVIDLIKKMPGGGVDIEKIVNAINENTAAVNNHGGNIEYWLEAIWSLLGTINSNIKDLDATCSAGFQAVIKAIGDKICKVDLSAVISKLDEILKAIKDHKVKIVIEDNRSTAQPGDGVNEGEIDPQTQQTIDDLNWLLG